jgi:hypothetical protein
VLPPKVAVASKKFTVIEWYQEYQDKVIDRIWPEETDPSASIPLLFINVWTDIARRQPCMASTPHPGLTEGRA